MNDNDFPAARGNGRARPAFGQAGRFEDRLAYGAEAERRFERWAGGFAAVAPLARLPAEGGRGPRLLTPAGWVTAPDALLVMNGRAVMVDVKRRRRPDLHRRTQTLVTGIEAAEFEGYVALAHALGTPVFVVFVHDEGAPGLRGDDVRTLEHLIHHEADGMAFWAIDDLRQLRREDLPIWPSEVSDMLAFD